MTRAHRGGDARQRCAHGLDGRRRGRRSSPRVARLLLALVGLAGPCSVAWADLVAQAILRRARDDPAAHRASHWEGRSIVGAIRCPRNSCVRPGRGGPRGYDSPPSAPRPSTAHTLGRFRTPASRRSSTSNSGRRPRALQGSPSAWPNRRRASDQGRSRPDRTVRAGGLYCARLHASAVRPRRIRQRPSRCVDHPVQRIASSSTTSFASRQGEHFACSRSHTREDLPRLLAMPSAPSRRGPGEAATGVSRRLLQRHRRAGVAWASFASMSDDPVGFNAGEQIPPPLGLRRRVPTKRLCKQPWRTRRQGRRARRPVHVATGARPCWSSIRPRRKRLLAQSGTQGIFQDPLRYSRGPCRSAPSTYVARAVSRGAPGGPPISRRRSSTRMTSIIEEEDVPAGKRLFRGRRAARVHLLRPRRARAAQLGWHRPVALRGRTVVKLSRHAARSPARAPPSPRRTFILLELRVDSCRASRASFGLARVTTAALG